MEGLISLECTREDFKIQESERKAKVDLIKAQVKELKNDPKADSELISNLIQKAQELEASKVDETKFFGSSGKSKSFYV